VLSWNQEQESPAFRQGGMSKIVNILGVYPKTCTVIHLGN
jgi:hypothetical protein